MKDGGVESSSETKFREENRDVETRIYIILLENMHETPN